ncbi:MAG: sugar O-acetyltransferase [Kiritimatiellia bacterium]
MNRNVQDVFRQMIAGETYDPQQLSAERLRAQCLCHQYNQLSPQETLARQQCLHELLGFIGEQVCIEQPFHCDYGCNIKLGARTFLNYHCTMLDCAPITLGEHVLCGPNCSFYTAIHPLSPEERQTDLERALPIVIGDNVWLGGNVTILPGVTIGANSVVGAGSVVTKDLPPRVLAVGQPARIVRTL